MLTLHSLLHVRVHRRKHLKKKKRNTMYILVLCVLLHFPAFGSELVYAPTATHLNVFVPGILSSAFISYVHYSYISSFSVNVKDLC